jgi:hypothetical protein
MKKRVVSWILLCSFVVECFALWQFRNFGIDVGFPDAGPLMTAVYIAVALLHAPTIYLLAHSGSAPNPMWVVIVLAFINGYLGIAGLAIAICSGVSWIFRVRRP